MVTEQNPDPSLDPDFAEQSRSVMQAWYGGDVTAQSAEATLENMLEVAQQADKVLHQGVIDVNIGIIEGYLGNLTNSVRHFELARQRFESAGSQSRVIACDLNIGEVYRLQGNFNRAQMFFRRAYEDATRLNLAEVRARALTNEGQMWLSMDQLSRASTCLTDAIEISKTPYGDDDDYLEQTRLAILSETYLALTQIALHDDDLDVAWLYAKQSYDYGHETQQAMCIGFGNRAVADVITAIGDSPDDDFVNDPDIYYRIALEHFKTVKMEGDIAKTMFARGNSLVKRGRRVAAAKLYQHALAIFSKLGMTDDAAKVADAQRRATR